MSQRRRHSADFKAQVVLEALRGERSINELAGLYEVHPAQIDPWKRKALEGFYSTFKPHHFLYFCDGFCSEGARNFIKSVLSLS